MEIFVIKLLEFVPAKLDGMVTNVSKQVIAQKSIILVGGLTTKMANSPESSA